MADTPERTRVYRNHHLDSLRWDGVVPRDDDIVITTAYKAGTTWTQRIVAALLFGPVRVRPHGCLPVDRRPLQRPRGADARDARGADAPALREVSSRGRRRAASSHRRSTSWSGATRATCSCRCGITTPRTPISSTSSSTTRSGPVPSSRAAPATPRELWPRWISEGWFDWEPDGWPYWSHHHHLATWWAARDLPNVMFVHYGDLLTDTDAEMRRIAAFLDIEVDEEAWPEILRVVRIESMREDAQRDGDPASMTFERWRRELLLQRDERSLARHAHGRRSRAVRKRRIHPRSEPAVMARRRPPRNRKLSAATLQ